MNNNPNHTISFRKAADADIPRLVEVIRASFAEYEGRLDPPSSAERKTVEIVQQELVGGGAFVAEADRVIVGCVLYHPHPDYVYLDRLSVLPDFRRRGIAGTLIQAVETRTRTLGLSRVRLSVRLALTENRSYYERLGYMLLRYGTHAGYTSPTFVTLEKEL